MNKLSRFAEQFDVLPLKSRLIARVVLFLVIAGVGIPLVWNLSGWGPSARSAQDLYEKLESEGTPLNMRDHLKFMDVPNDEDCAIKLDPILKKIAELVEKLPEADRNAIANYGNKTIEPAVEQRILARFRTLLAEASDAFTGRFFVPKLLRPNDYQYANVGWAQRYQDLLRMSARYHASMGQSQKAIGDLNSLKNLGNAFGRTPGASQTRSSWGAHQKLCLAVKECIERDPDHALTYLAALDQLVVPRTAKLYRIFAYQAIADARNITMFDLARLGEAAIPSSYSVEVKISKAKKSGLPTDPIILAMTARLLQRYDSILSMVGPDDKERVPGALRKVILKMERADYDRENWEAIDSLVRLWFPINLYLSEEKTQAHIALARAFGLVVAHRNAKGSWPKTLSEIGADFADPLGSRSIRYRCEGTGFRVWSVGEDETDNGGYDGRERQAMGMEDHYRQRDLPMAFRPASGRVPSN